ncbi:DUF5682 family protein [Corynebacterium cystitidis]|uniref:Protein containing von Willebrand factor type A (VWA) domain n=1 Tax=Corynebacterium cystitidis DSM 20524 TaxID=1121357 RepID=A0A1H9PTH5_9CORY|nr:DUF5682 family protein [Corynebacterium cystitidis]WJY82388.1 VWA domain containing CoxE-like protein [Corynebacterium cystitidis DSM 20524]SER51514.1 Protein containing von Willebrand factor type A (vWA) domain [Corynebacterium cystitidis DSM 20524]SNV76038.1 Mg-chelatase subunit ChlD [Corynebacterium cystitidis]
MNSPDPRVLIDEILRHPFTIVGVRHHSPACATMVIDVANTVRPTAVAVELPVDLQHMVPDLVRGDLRAPVAIAAAWDSGAGLWPFADFSPELAIMRWAHAQGIPIYAIDLPAGTPRDDETATYQAGFEELIGQDNWDRNVEGRAPGQSSERVRRAAIGIGVASRMATTVDRHTMQREVFMRNQLDQLVAVGHQLLTVVGSFHAAGLVEDSQCSAHTREAEPVNASLIPFSFTRLDTRGGYASGIRDPQWQQHVWEARSPQDVVDACSAVLTDIARACRESGEQVGTGEIAEAHRVATSLATLRHMPAPGRLEIVEAATSVFAQGSVTGRGRIIAQAMEKVLVGTCTGHLPDSVEQPALVTAVRQELKELKMPTTKVISSLRIEPYQSTGLRRHLMLERLSVAGVDYLVERTATEIRGLPARSYTARVQWSEPTQLGLHNLVSYGARLDQAVDAWLCSTLHNNLQSAGTSGDVILHSISQAARTGSPRALRLALESYATQGVTQATFTEVVRAMETIGAVAQATLPSTQILPAPLMKQAQQVAKRCEEALVRELAGIRQSENEDDARLLPRAVAVLGADSVTVRHELTHMCTEGSALMQGAGLAVSARYSVETGLNSHAAIAGWLVGVATPVGRKQLQRRVTGFLLASGGSWVDAPELEAFVQWVEQCPDSVFLTAAPSLRTAFDDATDVTSREQFLQNRGVAHSTFNIAPQDLERFARVDEEIRQRLTTLGLADVSFQPATRWRLLLGLEYNKLGQPSFDVGITLDQLYGHAGGRGRGWPAPRHWAERITAHFGADMLEEIAGEAVERGNLDLVSFADPRKVRADADVLAQVLALRGGLPQGKLDELRPIVRRAVAELSEKLATEIHPALNGALSTTTGRRRSARINLAATLRRNMKHVAEVNDRPVVVPVTPLFYQPRHEVSPWHIIVLVDVSGSMAQSTVFAALTGAILASVKTLRISFLTFSDSVVDLSDHIGDPLELLLEISIGGGTDIGSALRYTRQLIDNPARTAIITISDFHEGYSTGDLVGEVQWLSESGVQLLGCAALNDQGEGVYDVAMARTLAERGMRVATMTPSKLAEWVAGVLA